MIITVILGAMILGWFFGNFFLDKWVNRNNDEINNKD